MKRSVFKIIVTCFVLLLIYICLNENLYQDLYLPWYKLRIEVEYFIYLIISFYNIRLFYKISNRYDFLYYIFIILGMVPFVTNDLGMAIVALYGMVLVLSATCNLVYKINKEVGYSFLFSLFCIGYILVTSQIVILIN